MYLSLNDSFGPSEFEAAGWNLIPSCRERDLQGIQASIKSPLAPALATFSQLLDAQARRLGSCCSWCVFNGVWKWVFIQCSRACQLHANHNRVTSPWRDGGKNGGKNDKRKGQTDISTKAATQKHSSYISTIMCDNGVWRFEYTMTEPSLLMLSSEANKIGWQFLSLTVSDAMSQTFKPISLSSNLYNISANTQHFHGVRRLSEADMEQCFNPHLRATQCMWVCVCLPAYLCGCLKHMAVHVPLFGLKNVLNTIVWVRKCLAHRFCPNTHPTSN